MFSLSNFIYRYNTFIPMQKVRNDAYTYELSDYLWSKRRSACCSLLYVYFSLKNTAKKTGSKNNIVIKIRNKALY